MLRQHGCSRWQSCTGMLADLSNHDEVVACISTQTEEDAPTLSLDTRPTRFDLPLFPVAQPPLSGKGMVEPAPRVLGAPEALLLTLRPRRSLASPPTRVSRHSHTRPLPSAPFLNFAGPPCTRVVTLQGRPESNAETLVFPLGPPPCLATLHRRGLGGALGPHFSPASHLEAWTA